MTVVDTDSPSYCDRTSRYTVPYFTDLGHELPGQRPEIVPNPPFVSQ